MLGAVSPCFADDVTYDANGFSTDESSPYQEPSAVDGVYQISNAGELYWYAATVNSGTKAAAVLTADITVNQNVIVDGALSENASSFRVWTPIKTLYNSFDGQGHTISGLYFSDDSKTDVGFIGHASSDDIEIKNLSVADSYFKGSSFVGGIAGYAKVSSISDCHFSGIIEGTSELAGIAGHATNSSSYSISNCSNEGTVTGTGDYVGGIVGESDATATLTGCSNAGAITSGRHDCGGIIGFSVNQITLDGCHNSGNISGKTNVGGAIGYTSAYASVSKSYNSGVVSASNGYQGGIIGETYNNADITNCYHSGSISGSLNNMGGIIGCIAGRYYNVNITNCHVAGDLLKYNWYTSYNVYYGYSYSTCNVVNCYSDKTDYYGKGMTVSSDFFTNGTVAYLLGKGTDGNVWGQNVGTDQYPVLTGELLNADITEYNVDFVTYDGDEADYMETYVSGISWQLPSATRDGYTFIGWYDNDEFEGDAITTIADDATGDKTFYGKFGKQYNITYDYNYDGASASTATYTEGVEYTLATDGTRNGYIFNGWYADEELSDGPYAVVDAKQTGDKAFYAKWFEISIPETDEDGVYLISNAAELYGFAAIVNGTHGQTMQPDINARITADITVNEGVLDAETNGELVSGKFFMAWSPIGTSRFGGYIDGGNHTISGLYANGLSYSALVGYVYYSKSGDDDAHKPGIKDLTVKDSYFSGSYAAGLCAYVPTDIELSNLTSYARVAGTSSYGYAAGVIANASSISTPISGCKNYGHVTGSGYYAAGICSYFYSNNSYTLEITDCENYGNIECNSSVGGIVAYSYGKVSSCKNYGDLSSSNYNFAGGIAGQAYSANGCHNYGNVMSSGYAAGIVANLESNSSADPSVTLCSNHGDVESTGNYAGGIVAELSGGPASYCYNTGAVKGLYAVGGIVGQIWSYGTGNNISNCFNTGDIESNYSAGGIVGLAFKDITSCYSTGNVVITTDDENYLDRKGSICGYAPTVKDEETGEVSYKYAYTYVYNDSDFCSENAFQDKEAEGVDMSTIQLCNAMPEGFSSDVWTAGSIVNDAENSKVVFKLPYITALGEEGQQTVEASYVVENYTEEYDVDDEFVKDGNVTFTLSNDKTFGAELSSDIVVVETPDMSEASDALTVEAKYDDAVSFSYIIKVVDTSTAIDAVSADEVIEAVYNVAGQYVGKEIPAERGLYIVKTNVRSFSVANK